MFRPKKDESDARPCNQKFKKNFNFELTRIQVLTNENDKSCHFGNNSVHDKEKISRYLNKLIESSHYLHPYFKLI